MAETYSSSAPLELFRRFDVLPGLSSQYKYMAVAYEMFVEGTAGGGGFGTVTGSGRAMTYPLDVRPSVSYGNKGEFDKIPESDVARTGEATVTITEAWSRYRITERAGLASSTEKGAFQKATAYGVLKTTRYFGQASNRELYMTGTGALARVNTTISANTFVVDDNQAAGAGGTFGLDFIEVGQRLTNSTVLTGVNPNGTMNAIVTGKTTSTLTVTVEGAGQIGNLANNDYVILGSAERNSFNRGMTGLLAWIDDGTNTATVGGINRTTAGNEYWQAGYEASIGTSPLEQKILSHLNTRWKTNGADIDVVLTTPGVELAHFNQMVGERRYVTAAETGTYNGGYEYLAIRSPRQNKPLIWKIDRDCPKGTALLINKESFKIMYLPKGKPDWFRGPDGGTEWMWVPDYSAHECSYRTYRQLICTAPNMNVKLTGITEA